MSETSYQITADSGCDLSLEKCREINVVPYHMPFTMDGNPMVDGMTEEKAYFQACKGSFTVLEP